jgi:hypothetical protein
MALGGSRGPTLTAAAGGAIEGRRRPGGAGGGRGQPESAGAVANRSWRRAWGRTGWGSDGRGRGDEVEEEEPSRGRGWAGARGHLPLIVGSYPMCADVLACQVCAAGKNVGRV